MGIGQGSGFGGFASGLLGGMSWEDQHRMEGLKRRAYTAGVVNPALRQDASGLYKSNLEKPADAGQTPQISDQPIGLGQRLHQLADPVISRFYSKFRRPSTGSPGAAAQTTVPPQTDQAASAPQPTQADTATALPAQAAQGAWNAQNYGPQTGIPPMANGGAVGKPRGVFPPSGVNPKSGIKPKHPRTPPSRTTEPVGGDQGVPMADGGGPGRRVTGPAPAIGGTSVGDPRFQDNPNEDPAALAEANQLSGIPTPTGFAGARSAPRGEAVPAAKRAFGPNENTSPAGVAPGETAPTQEAPPPVNNGQIDFSQVDVDHTDIPQVSTVDWDKAKQASIWDMVNNGMDPLHARVSADEAITGYQQKQFTEYLQQGIALDRAGHKKGAMAALRMAYQYMPTGHDVRFGTAPNGDIVGFGIDEKTGQPTGQPMLLDQRNLNGLLATYQNPENFRQDLAGYQGMQMAVKQFNEITRPLAGAQQGLMAARSNYLYGANQARVDAASVRSGGAQSAQLLQNSRFFEQQLNNDPDMMTAPPGAAGQLASIAAQLQAQAPGVAQAQILAAVKNLLRMPPDQQAQWFQKYGINPNSLGAQQQQQSGIPPQSQYANPDYDALYGQ